MINPLNLFPHHDNLPPLIHVIKIRIILTKFWPQNFKFRRLNCKDFKHSFFIFIKYHIFLIGEILLTKITSYLIFPYNVYNAFNHVFFLSLFPRIFMMVIFIFSFSILAISIRKPCCARFYGNHSIQSYQ